MPVPLDDLLIEHVPALRRFARSLERNRSDADDLVQATLERAIKKIHLYQPTGPFIGWLNTIMRNVFVDRVRSRASYRIEPLDEPNWHEASYPATQTDRVLLRELRGALEKLTPEHREVLLLVAVHGTSYEDAAQLLQIPMGTIRSRLFRARQTLQQLIDPSGNATWARRRTARAEIRDENPSLPIPK